MASDAILHCRFAVANKGDNMDDLQFVPEDDTPLFTSAPLEHKAFLDVGGANRASDAQEFMALLEEFKATNNQRLAAIESKGAVDPLTDAKLGRIEKRLDALDGLLLKSQRPKLESTADFGDIESKAAMDTYVRKGKTDGYDAMESKGLSVGSEADGGYLVHPQMETDLLSTLRGDSPMRALASTLTISAGTYKRPFVVSGTGGGWVGETANRGQTASPQLAEMAYPAMELYAMPAATKTLLDDSAVDIERWLIDEMNEAFGEQESQAFIAGDGVARPKGILAYPREPAAQAGFGTIGTVETGTAGNFDADEPADALFELVHSLPAKYRRNGTFLMNRMTLSAVRRLTNADGDYLFQANLSDSLKMSLLGFPIVECDDMPDIAVDSPAVAFGDFARAYLIVDRQGVQLLRDPFSAKPYVLFYATKRVGGGMADFNALRILTFSV